MKSISHSRSYKINHVPNQLHETICLALQNIKSNYFKNTKMNVDDIEFLNCLVKPLKIHHSSCGFSICFKTTKIVDVPLKTIKPSHLNKLQTPLTPLIDNWMKHQYLGFL